MKVEDIIDILSKQGVSQTDTVMCHVDTAILTQVDNVHGDEGLDKLIKCLVSFFENGTLIIPAFSYSFTKNEPFDPANTPSEVGLFSESFRQYPGPVRTDHPIFSVCVSGRGINRYCAADLTDSFGENSIFGFLHRDDAKIVCIGCGLDRVTFVHFLEQSVGVSYRYFKKFSGKLIKNKQVFDLSTRYFVRNQEIESQIDLSSFKNAALRQKLLKTDVFVRFPISSISARSFFDLGAQMISVDEYSLIKASKS